MFPLKLSWAEKEMLKTTKKGNIGILINMDAESNSEMERLAD